MFFSHLGLEIAFVLLCKNAVRNKKWADFETETLFKPENEPFGQFRGPLGGTVGTWNVAYTRAFVNGEGWVEVVGGTVWGVGGTVATPRQSPRIKICFFVGANSSNSTRH